MSGLHNSNQEGQRPVISKDIWWYQKKLRDTWSYNTTSNDSVTLAWFPDRKGRPPITFKSLRWFFFISIRLNQVEKSLSTKQVKAQMSRRTQHIALDLKAWFALEKLSKVKDLRAKRNLSCVVEVTTILTTKLLNFWLSVLTIEWRF